MSDLAKEFDSLAKLLEVVQSGVYNHDGNNRKAIYDERIQPIMILFLSRMELHNVNLGTGKK